MLSQAVSIPIFTLISSMTVYKKLLKGECFCELQVYVFVWLLYTGSTCMYNWLKLIVGQYYLVELYTLADLPPISLSCFCLQGHIRICCSTKHNKNLSATMYTVLRFAC